MSSGRDFERADGELGRWIDARTIELLEDLEEHWGGVALTSHESANW